MLTESVIAGQTCAVSGASTGMSFLMASWKTQYTNFVIRRDHLVREVGGGGQQSPLTKCSIQRKRLMQNKHPQQDTDCHTSSRRRACSHMNGALLSLRCFHSFHSVPRSITMKNSETKDVLFFRTRSILFTRKQSGIIGENITVSVLCCAVSAYYNLQKNKSYSVAQQLSCPSLSSS